MSVPDINALELMNEPVGVDDGANAEEFFFPKLPDDGDHTAVLHLGDRGVTLSRQTNKETGQKTGAGYVDVHLVARILDDAGEEGITVFDNPNSIVMDSGTSRLHAILALAGHAADSRNAGTQGKLKTFVETALAQAPRIVIVTQWQASAKAEDQDEVANAIAAGFAKASKLKVGGYYTFLKGQRKFPEKEDGSYDPEVTNPVTGETVRAQVKIVRYKKSRSMAERAY